MGMQPDLKPTQLIEYDGKTSALYKIFFLNLFLGIITLGIYHFWGKTRQRRYVTASFSLLKDRFEYTGYGGELFKGILKAFVILLIVSIPLLWAFYQLDSLGKKLEDIANSLPHTQETTQLSTPEQKQLKASQAAEIAFKKLKPTEQKEFYGALILMGAYAIFYYGDIPFVAAYGSLRYRASRTRWRGICAHVRGSSLLYGLVGLMHLMLKILTLGFWIPFADLMTYCYKMKRLSFGSVPARFAPRYGQLFLAYLINLFIALGLAAAASAIGYFLWPVVTNGDPHLLAILPVIFIFTFVIVFFIARYWYQACLLTLKYECLHFDELSFHCKVSGWQLFKQLWGNRLIILFTLGLGSPIVTQRRQRFFCQHVNIIGNIDKMMIHQASGQKSTDYEGVSSIIDLNIGLF